MANYNKSVNFAVKDTLQSGDPNKIVSGAEIDTEFNNVSASSTTKIDKVPAAQVNNVASFNATGALQDSGSPSTALIPSGGIIIWSGLLTAIPTGWGLCDGSNGTPDLRDRFVVGAGSSYSRNETGGADSVALSENELPSHNHSMNSAGNHDHGGSTSTDGEHTHSNNADRCSGSNYVQVTASTNNAATNRRVGLVDATISPAGDHNHSISDDGSHTHSINNTGNNDAHENRPPYFALAYIMKL